MSDHDTPPALTEAQLEEFANELRRLSLRITRGIRLGQFLPALSDVFALRPVHELLSQNLQQRVLSQPEPTPLDGDLFADSAYL